MLTKSLHTITAATNVAAVLLNTNALRVPFATPAELARAALMVLGHKVDTQTGDPTVARIVANCAKLLKE